MDYHSMTRRELQALCKEHNIPANSANSVLADKLSELLNEKQKRTSRQRTCMKSAVETTDENEPAASRRQAKKVRFSPTNDLIEYELRSGKKEKDMITETKHRRKSVAKKFAEPVVDNINTVELTDDGVQIPVRATRSRMQGKDDAILINEKKQRRRAVKDVKKETDAVKELEVNLGKVTRSKVHTLGKGGSDENKQNNRAVKDVEKAGESTEGTVVGRVRVTRSKAQTLMEDSIGPNLNPQVKKKSGRQVVKDVENVETSKEIMDAPVRVTRSRGQTKVSDMSNNLSNVASENNQELPRRKSPRTSGVEVATEDGSEKLGHGKRKKRSEESTAESQHHADKEPRQSRRNRAKVEDSTVLNPSVGKVELVVDKKVTRSKAVLATKSSEGNNKNRAKDKAEVQRESKIAQQREEPLEYEGRKNANRRKSVMQKVKGKGIDKPLVKKRETVKEMEMVESPNRKTVGKRKSKEQSEGLEDEENVTRSGKEASESEMRASGSHKSKKKRGNPVIETVFVSPVNESPRRPTRSTSKSDGKAVSYPRQNYVAKKQQESSVKAPASKLDNQLAVKSAFKDNSSKRRAKLSESKPSHSEEHAEKFSTVSNFELDQKVTEIECTPVIEESIKRVTRSGAIRSERNAAVNTTAGRFTRSGIKHRENVGSTLFETVDKEKQQSQSPEVTGVTNSRVIKEKTPLTVQKTDTIGVPSEISKEAEDQILERSDDLSVKESVTEENRVSMSEAAIVMENVSLVFAEDASRSAPGQVMEVEGADIEKSPVQFTCTAAENETGATPHLTEDETASGTNFSDIKRTPFPMADVSETMPDDVQNQNQEAYVKSATFNEAQVQVAVTIEKSDVKSARPDTYEKEMESTRSESMSKRLQPDVMVEEPALSVPSVDISPRVITKGTNSDAENNYDSISHEAGPSAVCHASFDQSYDKSESKEMEDPVEPSIIEGVEQFIEDDVSFTQIEKGCEQDVLIVNDSLQNPSAGKHEIADDDAHNDDGERANNDDDAQNAAAADDDAHNEVADDDDAHNDDDETANDDVAQNADGDAHNEIAEKQLMDESVFEDNGVLHGSSDAEANGDDPMEQSTGNDVVQGFAMDENDIKFATQDDSLAEQSELSIGKNTTYATDDEVDNGKEELKSEVMPLPSIDNDVFQMPILNKSDSEDGTVKEHESNSKMLTGTDVDFNMTMDLEPISEPSTTTDLPETPISGKCDNATDALKSYLKPSDGDDLEVEDDTINVPKDIEPGLVPSNTLEIVSDDKTDGQDGESEQERLTSNYSSAMDDQNVGDDELEESIQNENMPMEVEVLIASSDQKAESVLNVADDEVPCDIVDVCASVEQPDSSTHEGTPQTPATNENDIPDSNIDINKDDVFKTSGDVDGLENATTGVIGTKKDIDFCGSEHKSKESDSMNNEQKTEEEAETMPENDQLLDDRKEQTVATVDHSDTDNFKEECSNHGVDEENTKTPQNTDQPLDDRKEQTVATVDHSMDTNNFMEECSNHGVDEEHTKSLENPTTEETSPITYTEEKRATAAVDEINLGGSDKFIEDIGVDESPFSEENLAITYKKEELDDTISDPPTFFKDDDINKQEETQQASTSVDRRNHSSGEDENQKPVSANESDYVLAESLPITYKKEEFDDTVSDPPTFFKDDDINKQEETQQASTSVDWGNHISGIDEYQKPLSATDNESDGVLAEIMKEDRVSDLQTCGRASSSMEKSSSPAAAEFVNSVTNLEKASTNEADANANADVPEDFFNWSDSPLKALFTTPTTNRTSNVKHDQEDAVHFTFPEDTRSCDDIQIRGSVAHDFDGQWESQQFDDKTQDTAATQSNEMYGVSNYEEFSHKYFGDEVDGSSEKKKENKP